MCRSLAEAEEKSIAADGGAKGAPREGILTKRERSTRLAAGPGERRDRGMTFFERTLARFYICSLRDRRKKDGFFPRSFWFFLPLGFFAESGEE